MEAPRGTIQRGKYCGGRAMQDITKQRRVMMIENSVTLVCFTVLAIVFRKWWIVLISVFFTSYERKGK